MKQTGALFFLFLSFSFSLLAKPVFKSESIFPFQNKHVHASSIVECPNGDLLVCWFHGSGERTANDVKVQGARLKKGSQQWSPVFLMADTPNLPDCNPVLFIDANERLWLFWIAVQAGRWERSVLKYRFSTDYQQDGPPKWTWQDVILFQPGDTFARVVKESFDELITDEPVWAEYAPLYSEMIIEAAKDPVKRQTGWMTRIHPFVLPNGRILLPLYSDGFNVSLMGISDDLGENWRASQPIVGLGPIQPTVARKKDGTLVAYLRDSGGPPHRVMHSESKDDGESWTPAVDTEIPNPGSSLEVLMLADSRWVMVFNDTEDGRHRLAVALSDDEGATWKVKKYVDQAEPGQKSFAYPSLIQTSDGLLHLTYSYHAGKNKTINQAVFNVEWILIPE